MQFSPSGSQRFSVMYRCCGYSKGIFLTQTVFTGTCIFYNSENSENEWFCCSRAISNY